MSVPQPKNYAPTLLKNAFENSVISPLTESEPLPLGDTVIPQYDGGIEAGVVGEAQPTKGEQSKDGDTYDREYVDKLRKEAAKYRTEARSNADAAKRLAEIEDAQKTAEQKAAEREAAAEKRIAEAEARAARRDIAIEHGLSSEDAALLDDLTDEDAMRRLAGRLAAAADAAAKPRTPRPNPAQSKADIAPVEDRDSQARAVFGI